MPALSILPMQFMPALSILPMQFIQTLVLDLQRCQELLQEAGGGEGSSSMHTLLNPAHCADHCHKGYERGHLLMLLHA